MITITGAYHHSDPLLQLLRSSIHVAQVRVYYDPAKAHFDLLYLASSPRAQTQDMAL